MEFRLKLNRHSDTCQNNGVEIGYKFRVTINNSDTIGMIVTGKTNKYFIAEPRIMTKKRAIEYFINFMNIYSYSDVSSYVHKWHELYDLLHSDNNKFVLKYPTNVGHYLGTFYFASVENGDVLALS